jgi:4-hydroxy-tetrahydrodipicolinate synthase
LPASARLRGLLPAIVTPFLDDDSVDSAALERWIAHIACQSGVAGVLMHGHTGEILTLTSEERVDGVRRARTILGAGTVIAGVHEQSTRAAARAVELAADAGADAAMVFSPFSFGRGGMATPEAVVGFYRTVAAVGLPILFMQYPQATGMKMPPSLLTEVASLAGVIGVKEAVGDIGEYEADWNALRALSKDLSVLTASEGALYSTLAVGAHGALIGFGNFPELIVPLMEAMERGDLGAARAANARLYTLQRAIYGLPSFRWSARLKYALFRQGRIPSPRMRGPLTEAGEAERATIDRALDALRAPVLGGGQG